MRGRLFVRIACLMLALAAPTACKKRLLADPAPPPTPTPTFGPTATPDCNCPYQVLSMPGSQPVTNMGIPIGIPTVVSTVDWFSTPVVISTLSPISPPDTIKGSLQVLRSEEDWLNYCADLSVDPTATPSPVDFSKKMILLDSYVTSNCPSNTYFDSLCRYSDRYEVRMKTRTGNHNCLQVIVTPVLHYVGYVVDQAPVSAVKAIELSLGFGLFSTPTPVPTPTPTP